jgi:predicted NBD/HSP70 family sugar kinase
LDPAHGVVFGLEFGHRHLAVGIADLHGRLLDPPKYAPKDPDEDPRITLDRAAEWMKELLAARSGGEDDVVGVGMSLAHPIDVRHKGSVRALSMVDDRPWQRWQGLGDICQQLQQRLGWSEDSLGRFIADNDANLSAIAEQRWGAGKGRRHFVYIRWSDGIGAGLILDGRLYRGVGGIAGALGHTPIVDLPEPKKCPRCGLYGCLETVASRTRILEAAEIPDGEDATEQLVEKAAVEDSAAFRSLDRASFSLGRAIGTYLHALNPEALVIGGSVGSKVFDLVRNQGLERGLWRQAVPSALEDVNTGGIHKGRFVLQTALRGALAQVLWEHLPDFLAEKIESGASPLSPDPG